MKIIIILSMLLSGCIEMIEVPVQFNAYACTDGWQYTLTVPPAPIMDDETGKQLTCNINDNLKQEIRI